MSAFDAVDVSSTGIAMCHIAVSFDRIANVRCCHIAVSFDRIANVRC
jgi:hypothetical protein